MELIARIKVSLLLFVAVSALEKARFDNYRLYKISIDCDDQVKLFEEIERNPDGYRFFSGSINLGNNLQFVVPPHKFAEFSELQERFHLKTQLIYSNLQEFFDEERRTKTRNPKAVYDWTKYWTLDEVNEWMDELITSYPQIVSSITIGRSYEGREIRGVKFNTGGNEAKSSIFFESAIHANEWITTASTTWMMNELLTSDKPEIKLLLDRYEWYFLPVLNVDGYVYTFTTDRMWRKSRKPQKNLLCTGADLNRNWDLLWGRSSPKNPCDTRYGGDFVFSEPEAKSLSEFLPTIPRLVGYFSLHSYGQFFMFPYAYTFEKIETYDILHDLGMKGLQAMEETHGKVYGFGPFYEFYPNLSATSADWVAVNLKPNVTFMYEMRPTRGEDGSDAEESERKMGLGPEEVIENAEEIFASITTILLAAIEIDFA